MKETQKQLENGALVELYYIHASVDSEDGGWLGSPWQHEVRRVFERIDR